jgi:hypothetical protein
MAIFNSYVSLPEGKSYIPIILPSYPHVLFCYQAAPSFRPVGSSTGSVGHFSGLLPYFMVKNPWFAGDVFINWEINGI